jgi:hypothetical protein
MPASRRARVPVVARVQRSIDGGFSRLRAAYGATLEQCLTRRGLFTAGSSRLRGCPSMLLPYVGQDFFPDVDSGQFKLHFRAPTGTRIEETARLADAIEDAIREVIPAKQIVSMLDNIGLPVQRPQLAYTNSAPIGAQDADILVALAEDHPPTAGYVRDLRRVLESRFPGVQFSFIARTSVSQILSFGLPAPNRRADRRAQLRREPAVRREAGGQAGSGAGHRRPARAPGGEFAVARGERGPHARRAVRLHAARRGQQPAHLAERQRPDLADVLAQPRDRRELCRGDDDAAVPDGLPAGSAEHSDHRRRQRHGATAASRGWRTSRAAPAWRSCRTTTCSR